MKTAAASKQSRSRRFPGAAGSIESNKEFRPSRSVPKSARPLSSWAPGGLVHAIIDTPRGSSNKYKLDEDTGLFKLGRILPEGMHFPCDFGSIPGTEGDDGDALDVAILVSGASFVGCLMTVRLVGIICAEQVEKRRRIRNDRLLGVPITPVNHPAIHALHDVPPDTLTALEQFFFAYNHAQGRTFVVMAAKAPLQRSVRSVKAFAGMKARAASCSNREEGEAALEQNSAGI